jgi:Galactose oxidase, central domain
MKTECTSRVGFLNLRVLISFALCSAGLVLTFGAMSSAAAEDNADAELSQSVPAHAPGRWRVTGDLVTAREGHRATLLPNGQVLVAGGFGLGSELASVELYDPATGMWTATGSMTTARYRHTATLLPNGQVLVADGYGSAYIQPIARAELYDPESGSWTATASLKPGRVYHAATLLLNGKVLVSGGDSRGDDTIALADLYKSAPEALEIQ